MANALTRHLPTPQLSLSSQRTSIGSLARSLVKVVFVVMVLLEHYLEQ